MREHALYQIVNGVNVAEVLEKSGGVLTKSDVDCFCRILMLETDDDFSEKMVLICRSAFWQKNERSLR